MTRIAILLVAVSVGMFAQQYPTAIATNLPAAADNAVATLAVSIDSSTSVITLTSASSFAANVPFKLDSEQIKCAILSGVQFSSCTRGYSGTTPASHSATAASCAAAPYPGCARGILVAAHVNDIRSEVIAMQGYFGVNAINLVRAVPTAQIESSRIIYGTGIGTAGAKSTYLFDSANDRMCIGCTSWDSTEQKLRILGTGNTLAVVRAGTGNFGASVDVQSGAGGSTGDNAFVSLWNAATVKWTVAGVYNGNNSFRIIDRGDSDVTRFIIDPSTHLITLQPTAASVNIIGNAAGTATATGIVDFGASASTNPCKEGTSTPGTCSVGQCFFDTDETAGENLYLCTATDTWTQVVGSGGALEGGYTASFSSQDPLTILAATHELTECPADVKIWSVSGSTLTLTAAPDLVTCNDSTLTVTVDFPASTSGVVYLIPKGGTVGGGGGSSIIAGAPASSSASCLAGEVRFDTSYIYLCVATDTWKRSLMNTW